MQYCRDLIIRSILIPLFKKKIILLASYVPLDKIFKKFNFLYLHFHSHSNIIHAQVLMLPVINVMSLLQFIVFYLILIYNYLLLLLSLEKLQQWLLLEKQLLSWKSQKQLSSRKLISRVSEKKVTIDLILYPTNNKRVIEAINLKYMTYN